MSTSQRERYISRSTAASAAEQERPLLYVRSIFFPSHWISSIKWALALESELSQRNTNPAINLMSLHKQEYICIYRYRFILSVPSFNISQKIQKYLVMAPHKMSEYHLIVSQWMMCLETKIRRMKQCRLKNWDYLHRLRFTPDTELLSKNWSVIPLSMIEDINKIEGMKKNPWFRAAILCSSLEKNRESELGAGGRTFT